LFSRETEALANNTRALWPGLNSTDGKYVRGMLEAGAAGYLLKDEASETIGAAVRGAVRGERLWTTEQFARAQRGQEEVQERWKHLTEREREVLSLVAAGGSNKEIAQTLSITVRAVEFHVSNTLGKLGLTSRVEAVVWAKEHGLCNG